MSINVLDVFAGCGGMSLEAKWAGLQSVLAIDADQNCNATYSYNIPSVPFICKDIRTISAHQICNRTGKKIDILVGGPPCQGFSLANKHRNRKKDSRNYLLYEFVRFVGILKPKAFVLENVRGLISMDRGRVLKQLLYALENAGTGYRVSWKLLTASDYGVPQHRKRLIIIGYRNDLNCTPNFLDKNVETKNSVSLWEAISDLPKAERKNKEQIVQYAKKPQNKYQKSMRKYTKGVFNHVAMRHTKRIVERFKSIKIGQSLAHVSKKHLPLQRGNTNMKSTFVFSQNNQRLFPNKAAPTITASFQSNFIHPFLHRNLTAREAARLQSFPDTFIFKGKRTTMSWEKGLSQYQQIGNAVPPLLAYHILKQVKLDLQMIN